MMVQNISDKNKKGSLIESGAFGFIYLDNFFNYFIIPRYLSP